MDRKTYYYRQKVLEEHLNEAFDDVENAERNLSFDNDLMARTPPLAKSRFGGIVWGFDSDFSGTTLQIDRGVAYDETGNRVALSVDTYSLYLTNSGDTAIAEPGVTTNGTPDGSPIDPGEDKELWVTVYAVFERYDSNPAYDGYNDLINFDNNESLYFKVVAGTPVTIGTLDPDPAAGGGSARQANEVLLWDIWMRHATGESLVIYKIHGKEGPGWNPSQNAELDAQRTEWFFNYIGTNSARVRHKGNVRDVLEATLNLYGDHADGLADNHDAEDIVYSPGMGVVWADYVPGNFGASTNVEEALDGIVLDLAATAGNFGTYKIGTGAITGGLTTPDQSSPLSFSAGHLHNAMLNVINAVNGRIFRGGDDGVNGPISPASSGIDLGTASKRWDAFLANLDAEAVIADLLPATDNALSLGSALKRWHADLLNVIVEGTLDVSGVSTFTEYVEISKTQSGTIFYAENPGVTNAIAIRGRANGDSSSTGILGEAAAGQAITGIATSGYGIYGTATTGIGVKGLSTDSYAVHGVSTNDIGVQGDASTAAGVKGVSNSGPGVQGVSTTGLGISGSSFGLDTNDYVVQRIPMSTGCSMVNSSTGAAYWTYYSSLGVDNWTLRDGTSYPPLSFSAQWHPYGGRLLKVIIWCNPNSGTVTLNGYRKKKSFTNISSSNVAFTPEAYSDGMDTIVSGLGISGAALGRIEQIITVNNTCPRSFKQDSGGAYGSHDSYEVYLDFSTSTNGTEIHGVYLVWEINSVSGWHGVLV